MAQVFVTRLAGAALTIGGIAFSAFLNAQMSDKTVLHLVLTGVAAIVAVISIGIFEDAADTATSASKPGSTTTIDVIEPLATSHTAH